MTNREIAEKWYEKLTHYESNLGTLEAILSAITEATACAEEQSKKQAERIEELEARIAELQYEVVIETEPPDKRTREYGKFARLIRDIAEGSKDKGFSQEFIDRVKQENCPNEESGEG